MESMARLLPELVLARTEVFVYHVDLNSSP